jgi:hypothetical protein
MSQDASMEKVIDVLMDVLGRRFSQKVSNVYFGDIGIYLPASFGGSRNQQKAVIAISPLYNYLQEGSRVAAQETRLLGIDIITLVNITPFFEAAPKEAYGERMLVNLTTEISQFLTQEDNMDLGGILASSTVGNIDWAWVARNDQALRGAAIHYEARVRVDRL